MATSQAALLVALLFSAMAVNYSSGAYCVCKSGLSDAIYQKALDYACGNGGDCSPIAPSGACYNPDTLQAHCSYAVNSYYQKKSSQGATCDFGGTASLSSSGPASTSGCSVPSGGSTSGSTGTSPSTTTPSTSPTTPTTTPISGTPTSGTPTSGTSTGTGTPTSGTSTGTGTPVSGTPTTSSPYTTAPTTVGTTNPSTGTSPYLGGGMGGGIAPTGVGMNDENHASGLRSAAAAALCWALAGLVLLSWN